MQHRRGAGSNDQRLLGIREAGVRKANPILSNRHRAKLEFALIAASSSLLVVGISRTKHYFNTRDGSVAWIVHHTLNRSKNRGKHAHRCKQEEKTNSGHSTPLVNL